MKLEPPEYIDEEARVHFHRVVEMLGSRVHPSDIYIIAEFAQTLADIATLKEIVTIEGNTVTNPDSGAVKVNPNIMVLMGRRQALNQLIIQLGLSPKARKEKQTKEGKRLKDLL